MPPIASSRLRLQLSEGKLSNIGVQLIYGVGIIVWLMITITLGLWPNSSKTSRILLSIPILLCVCNIITPIPGSDVILDPVVEQSSLLTFILIGSSIISPWLTTVLDKKNWHYVRIVKAFVIMLILLTLTQYGLFALRYVVDFEIHVDNIINAMALSLLGYTVSEYLHMQYSEKRKPVHVDHEALHRTAARNNLAAGVQLNVINQSR